MRFKLLINILFFLIIQNCSTIALENKILLKVNNEIITTVDISNEMNYLQTINIETNELEKNILIDIAKNSLIREKIKKIEIVKNSIELKLGEEYLDLLIKNMYSNLGFKTKAEFNEYLKIKNIKLNRVKDKIIIDSIWKQFVYQKYKNKIKIDKEKIKNEISSEKNVLFNVSEILFNVEKNENINNKLKLIKKTIDQSGFENAALIYSVSDSSKNGGTIGWINQSAISKNILSELSSIKLNDITKPIKVSSGFLILKLNNIKKEEKEINLEKEINKITNIKINSQLNQFSNLYLKKVRKNIIIDEL